MELMQPQASVEVHEESRALRLLAEVLKTYL